MEMARTDDKVRLKTHFLLKRPKNQCAPKIIKTDGYFLKSLKLSKLNYESTKSIPIARPYVVTTWSKTVLKTF